MKLGTSEIHTINERQGSSMKGTEILSKTEVTGKLSPESNYNLGIEFTEITQELRVFNSLRLEEHRHRMIAARKGNREGPRIGVNWR